MSLQQKHVWRLLETEAGSIPCASCEVWLEEDIDLARLRLAIEWAVRRHEILRTVYQQFSGLSFPLQVISHDALFAFSSYDLRADTLAVQKNRLEQIRQTMACERSQLEHGPVLRIAVAVCAQKHTLLLCSAPALCMDTSSLRNLISEISTMYKAETRTLQDAEDAFQYADFAEWQQEMFEAQETQEATRYWQRPDLLAALPIPLPFEKSDAPHAFLYSRKACALPELLLEQLETVTGQIAVEPSLFLLTCWQVLLWRLLGRARFVLGVAAHDRKYAELADALGLFAQYVPVLCQFTEEQTFSDALAQVAEQSAEMRKWQEFFNWDVFQQYNQSDAQVPFVRAAFSWETYNALPAAPSTWQLNACEAIIDRASLCLNCTRYADRLQLAFVFDDVRVSEEDVARIVEQYQELLASALRSPATTLPSLKMIGPREQQQLLTEWNHANYDPEPFSSMLKLFKAQVKRHPAARALVVGGQELTYAELDERANRLAQVLHGHHCGPDTRVGLYLERSVEQVIAILGVFGAGAAYVPLDPTWPTERLKLLLQGNTLSLIITSAALRGSLLAEGTVPLLCIEDALSTPFVDQQAFRTVEVALEQLAYVLYTSGSTGTPKGVAVTHGNLSAYTTSLLQVLCLPEGASYATAAPLGADLGNTAIYAALSTGGCLHLLSWEQANDPHAWKKYLQEQSIDCVKMVPSHLSALLTGEHPEQALPARCLVSGGETLHWELARRIQHLRPECRVINHYGPTESTVGVLTYEVPAGAGTAVRHSLAGVESVPLGRPLAHVRAYVLNSASEPVSVWESGELYLGGWGVARGYQDAAELTAERFVPDPWSVEPGARLYRTGDIVRWLPDGTLEFVGRADRQIKIRGYRVESGEIEAILQMQPSVGECVVDLRKDPQDKACLVAYIVPATGGTVPVNSELRAALQRHLPDYMVPTVCIILESFPLTSVGKINRQALPQPDWSQPGEEKEYKGPRTEIERQLVTIWQRVLGRSRVGVEDNFFALGGDSILSIQLVARAGQLGLSLTPKQLFQAQTIAALGQLVSQPPTPAAQMAEQGVLLGDLEMTPIQHWFWQQPLSEPWHYNQEVLLQVRESLQVEPLEQAVRAVLAQHDALRLRVWREEDAVWRQAYGDVPPVGESLVEHVRLDGLVEQERAGALEAVAQRVQRGLDLGSGRLLRVMLVEWGEGAPQRILLVAHHLVIDGVSWRIVLEDLQVAYQQAQRGEAVVLGAKTSSYRQWVDGLKEWARSAELQEQASYWRERLGLVRGWGEGEEVGHWQEQETVEASLDAQETRALLEEVPQAYQTQINEVLITGLARSVAAWRGVGVVRLDMEGHGREGLEEQGLDVSRTVGWFTSIYPVVVEVMGDEQIGRDLKGVKEQMRAIPCHGLGYGVLRYLIADEATRDIRELPQGQIRLNYLGQIDQVLHEGWWQSSEESAGDAQSPLNKRPYQLDINALVTQGSLRMFWNYNTRFYKKEAIEDLAQQFALQLRALIVHCRQVLAGGSTPVELSDVELSQSELDDLFADIE